MKMPYDFRQWVHLVNGVPMDGFAPGDDSFELDRNTDSFSHEVGLDGRMEVSLSADRSGKITMKFQANSSANTYMQALMDLQEGGPPTFVPVVFAAKDQNLQDQGSGSVGYLLRPSKMTRGGKPGNSEWSLIVERLDLVYGGGLVTDLL